jgi:nucleolar protein 16
MSHPLTSSGPHLLMRRWDDSYRILGLMPNLNPRQAGGIEPVEGTPYAVSRAVEATLSDLDSDSADEESEDEDVPMASTSAPRKLALGEGRIVRDAEGKVIRIEMGGEDGEQVSEEVKERVAGESERDDDDEEESDEEEEEVVEEGGQTPWGAKMEVWDGEESEEEELKDEVPLGPRKTGQGIPIGVRTTKVLAKTDVVRG